MAEAFVSGRDEIHFLSGQGVTLTSKPLFQVGQQIENATVVTKVRIVHTALLGCTVAQARQAVWHLSLVEGTPT